MKNNFGLHLRTLILTMGFFAAEMPVTYSQNVPFDACDSIYFYVKPGPGLVGVKQVGASMVTVYDKPMLRVGGTGDVNGLAANYQDGFVYYLNKSGVNGYLIRIDANGDTIVAKNLGPNGYTPNACFDACNNLLRFKNGIGILRYDMITGVEDTILVPGLATSPDIMFNPFNGKTYHYTNVDGKVHVVEPDGTVSASFSSGVISAGSVALSQDGSAFVITNDGIIKWFNINTGACIQTKTLPIWAANAPIADNASFVCDDVTADITGGSDTLEIHTCQDSTTVTFTNYSSGTLNDVLWEFGDGTVDSVNVTPTHTFASNSIYTIAFTGTKFTGVSCHLGEPNYDTLVVKIVPDTVQISLTSSDPVCHDGTDGSATVSSATGGTTPYTYTWLPTGGTSATETGLSSGMYYVTVIDLNSCSDIDSVLLNNPPAIDATVITTDATCNGLDDGTATVVTGAAAVGPYTFAFSTGATTSSVVGLAPGLYSVSVFDVNLCELVLPFTVTEPTPVVAVPSNDTVICIGGTVSLSASAFGGNGAPFNFVWTGLPVGTTTANPLVATCYEVTAFDLSGCASVPAELCVTLNDPLSVSLTGENICPGETADLTSLVSGGDGVYTYSWNAGGPSIGASSSLSVSPAATTEYCLTVSDGCETPDANECIVVTVFDIPTVTLDPATGCEGLTLDFPSIPGGGSDFTWNFGDGVSSHSNSASHEYESDGNYTVTVSYTSADGCPVTASFENLVTILETPRAHFEYHPHDITVENTEVNFTNTSFGATHYLWNFGDGSAQTTEENPTHIFPEIGNLSYPVTLFAMNEACQDSAVVLIEVKEIIIVYVPNAFTPDGSGSNDEFKPVVTAGVDVYDYHLTIFNRWGERVFESYDSAYGWDGTYGNEGIAEDGTYVWQLIFKETMSDKMHEQTGHVTMLR